MNLVFLGAETGKSFPRRQSSEANTKRENYTDFSRRAKVQGRRQSSEADSQRENYIELFPVVTMSKAAGKNT